MKNLLTGSSGYIGSEVSKKMGGFDFCDLRSGQDYRDLDGHKYGVVVHLAAFVSVIDSIEKPYSYFENNCFGVRDFLRKNQIERMIFVSTGGALYGNKRLAKEHEASMATCLSPYAQSKFLGEEVVRRELTNHCILRLANVIGGNPKIRGEAACEQHFMADDPILVYGGLQTRDFVDMSVVVSAIWQAVDDPHVVGTFNIGSGEETLVMEMAAAHARKRGVRIRMKPHRPGELDFITLDTSAARAAGLL